MDNYRKNSFCNLIFSIVSAAQSFVLLWLINRILNENESGIFSYAFSVAALFMYIGNFGIRNFQVSDTKEKYKFENYCGTRVVTCFLMIICIVIFAIFKNISFEEMACTVSLCIFRLVESVEDVFHGRYQQKNCLYLASYQGTIRLLASDLAFVIGLMCLDSLWLSTVLYAGVSGICLVLFSVLTLPKFGNLKISFNFHKIKGLLVECFPLFLGYFISTYLCNLSKYALQKYVSSSVQSYYAMIFMPVLVVNLLSTIIFRPIIVEMAALINENKVKEYKKLVNKQLGFIAAISIVCMVLSYFLGIIVLTWFYGSDLSVYKSSFMILMLGGVFSAFSSFLNVCIITIRKQKALLIFNVFLVIAAHCITYYCTQMSHIEGASISFLISMIIQGIGYLAIHEIGIKRIRA